MVAPAGASRSSGTRKQPQRAATEASLQRVLEAALVQGQRRRRRRQRPAAATGRPGSRQPHEGATAHRMRACHSICRTLRVV